MARVNISKIVEDLDHDFKRALEDAVSNLYPEQEVDRNELYREFKRSVRRKFDTWSRVSDRDVETE